MQLMRRQFHGSREEADGVYVTTEFIAFWLLPLWPVASYRVGRNSENEKLPVQWGQAVEGWAVLLAVVGIAVFTVGLLYFAGKHGWSD
jgi:hypothetical protein